MNTYLLIAVASFAFIALRAFQQLNVMHDRRRWVYPTSGLMAIMEVTITLSIVQQGFWAWVPMFIGGGSGCILAMWVHKYMRKES